MFKATDKGTKRLELEDFIIMIGKEIHDFAYKL